MRPEDLWRLAKEQGLPVKAAYTASQAARLLGVGKMAVYEAVRSGRVKALRVGRVRYIPVAELVKLLEGGA
ncbi:helix-turn-helix domain-containing protein [Thermus antranikianii]